MNVNQPEFNSETRVEPVLDHIDDAVVVADSVKNADGTVDTVTPARRGIFSKFPPKPEAQEEPKKRFFKKGAPSPKKAKKTKAEKPDAPLSAPIQVFMGYLPEVSARDALEYAMGMADKYVTQEGLTFYMATPFGNGHIYELHEGGSGKAFGPEIVKTFQEAGPFSVETPQVLHIRTALKTLEVTREREGLSVVLLPDETELGGDARWVTPRKAMRPGIPRRTGMLYAGIGMLVSGTLAAVLTGAYFRLQGYAEPPAQPVVNISSDVLPVKQWNRVMGLENIKALKYSDGKWQPPEIYTEEELKGGPAPEKAESAEPGKEGAAQ